MTTALTAAERSLPELEAVIEHGVQTFVDVGLALAEVRDRKLYRQAGYTDFGTYCRERWDFSRSYGYRLMTAAQVAQELSPIGDTPATEAQARALNGIWDADDRAAVWAEALRRYPEGATAAQIKGLYEVRVNTRFTCAACGEQREYDLRHCPTCSEHYAAMYVQCPNCEEHEENGGYEIDEDDGAAPALDHQSPPVDIEAAADTCEVSATWEPEVLSSSTPWRRLDDLLQALDDAPQFGLLSYKPTVITEASDTERGQLRQRLAAVREWLEAFEAELGSVNA